MSTLCEKIGIEQVKAQVEMDMLIRRYSTSELMYFMKAVVQELNRRQDEAADMVN